MDKDADPILPSAILPFSDFAALLFPAVGQKQAEDAEEAEKKRTAAALEIFFSGLKEE